MSVVSYECPIAGESHGVPGDDVRVLRVIDGGFVVACDCGPEDLAEADTKPHPTTDHLVNIDGRDPSPEEWLGLDDAADGWYDNSQWDVSEKHGKTYGEWWASLRSGIEEMAETEDGRDLTPSDDEVAAREVPCPACGASAGRKCQRPSGHHVRSPHADRRELAISEGIIETDTDSVGSDDQATIERWA